MPAQSPYMKQLDAVPENLKLAQDHIGYINRTYLSELGSSLGLTLDAGSPVPESGGTPRIFILNENEPNRPRTLGQEGVQVGSADFWALMQQGKLFAYPAGEKEPVQLQLKGISPPELSFSAPLSTDPAKLASLGYKHPTDPPQAQKLPRQVARPGIFARMMHGLNKNWYKAEHEAYNNYLTQRRSIEESNRKAREAYDREVAGAKQSLDASCKAVSGGIAAAFGNTRTPQVFQAEQAQKQAAREARQRQVDQKARQSDLAYAEKMAQKTENSVRNMMSMYSPKPQALPELVKARCYTEESFQKLKPIELPKGLTVGSRPVDDRLFANVALHAQLDKDIALQLYTQKSDPAKLLDEGLTQQQADDLIIHKGGGMLIGDMVKMTPRPYSDQHFEHRVQPGRERAEKALLEYQKGNKAPLAEIIARSAVYVANCAMEDGVATESSMTDAKLTCELLDLLDEDPELREAAEGKGLTEKVEESCRGMDEIRKLDDQRTQALVVLRKAHAEGKELSEQEKTACASAIIKANTAKAMLAEQGADSNSKNYLTIYKRLQDRNMATVTAESRGEPLPEGVKPLDSGLATDLVAHYRLVLKPTPSTLGELVKNREAREDALAEGREPEPDSLDKITDMTVKGLGLDKLDTGTLAKKLGGDDLTSKDLLAEQGKLVVAQERIRLQQEADLKKEQALKEKLNNGINLGHKGNPM